MNREDSEEISFDEIVEYIFYFVSMCFSIYVVFTIFNNI